MSVPTLQVPKSPNKKRHLIRAKTRVGNSKGLAAERYAYQAEEDEARRVRNEELARLRELARYD